MGFRGPGGYQPGIGWGAWLFGALILLVLVGLLIAAIVALVRASRPGGLRARVGGQYGFAGAPHPAHAAEAILADRFARGEIAEQEYQARLAVLRGSFGGPVPPSPPPPPSDGPTQPNQPG